MVGDLDDHKISSVPNFNSVQNLRPLGSVEAYNFYNGVVREGGRELGTFCVLSRVASQLKKGHISTQEQNLKKTRVLYFLKL